EVTATVEDTCSISATNLAFGLYDPAADHVNGTSTITATCTENTTYDIGLDAGVHSASATTTTRAMRAGSSDYLDYELYQDSNRDTVWGNVIDTNTLQKTSPGGDEIHTVFGRIPGGQFVPAGSYSDTITVTITY
ncbi:spore coat protein, partial [Arsukibacterium sp. MJ3]|uniref:Csu type fimbrial protein n=1 Tax=Arsukibacterium sp. MJ3 TaxID=1632859 RepID=UPI000626F4C3